MSIPLPISEALLSEAKLSSELNRAAAALEAVCEVIASLQPATLSIEEWLEARARVGELLAQFDDAGNRVSKFLGIPSAEGRLLRYLQMKQGCVVGKDALSGVSGIYEWARRLRQLRVEQGWPIESGETRPDLKIGEYVLEADRPNLAEADAWETAKRVRNLAGSGKSRVIAYLQEIYPASADKKQLAYVAKIQEWPRRMRELEEEGHRIVSNVDDPTLAPGEYRLASLDLLPAKARQHIKLRYEILSRDRFRCRNCGASPLNGDLVTLQAHHIVLVSRGGTNAKENLITLCADCHAGQHSVLKGQIRDELLEPGSEPRM